MDEAREARFNFPQTLGEQSRPIGLPMDETVAIVGPFGWGIYTGYTIAGLVIAVLLYFLLRYFKKGRGIQWLFNACYWYFPSFCSKGFFLVIPDSAYRLWLK